MPTYMTLLPVTYRLHISPVRSVCPGAVTVSRTRVASQASSTVTPVPPSAIVFDYVAFNCKLLVTRDFSFPHVPQYDFSLTQENSVAL
ncbi:hypothetical protein XELAEV_18001841mg [Xenopus laevis]|nr:hypothetical protein XELAEV_18001841mg [Xenopus laevis]